MIFIIVSQLFLCKKVQEIFSQKLYCFLLFSSYLSCSPRMFLCIYPISCGCISLFCRRFCATFRLPNPVLCIWRFCYNTTLLFCTTCTLCDKKLTWGIFQVSFSLYTQKQQPDHRLLFFCVFLLIYY